MKDAAGGDRFFRFAALGAGVGVLGLVGAAKLPHSPEQRMGAFLGVAVAVVSSAGALAAKKWAFDRSVKWALGMVAATFGIRLVTVTGGLFYTLSNGWSEPAFVVGFFGPYFVLQWIELTYVMVEAKRRDRGGE